MKAALHVSTRNRHTPLDLSCLRAGAAIHTEHWGCQLGSAAAYGGNAFHTLVSVTTVTWVAYAVGRSPAATCPASNHKLYGCRRRHTHSTPSQVRAASSRQDHMCIRSKSLCLLSNHHASSCNCPPARKTQHPQSRMRKTVFTSCTSATTTLGKLPCQACIVICYHTC